MVRRLAAVLAADVVGYTRLMGADEAGTLRRLTDLRQTVLEPLVTEHHGRIVKLMGDGLLVEFASAVDSVACAVAWQDKVAHHEAECDAGKVLQFRIGINLGDVIAEDGDIHGDGVNIASRLEALAQPGSIYLSDDVYRHTRGKLEAQFEDTGEHKLKNVTDPVRVYRVLVGAKTSETNGDLAKADLSSKPAIAVLPFDNMSGDPEQDYFTDGITEDIITALSLWRSFPVIARNSSFTYKEQKIDVQRVGRELGVRYVLEGSVRKVGNRVRITGQLIDTEAGAQVWAERYDRDLDDIFDLQDEITERIVTHMVPAMGRAEEQRAVRKRPAELGAWDLLQRGCWHYHRFTQTDMGQARDYMEKSLQIDPLSGLANGYIAATHMFDAVMGWSDDRARSVAEGVAAAQHAIALDPNEPLPRTVLASLNVFNHEPERGIEEAELAVELNPSYSIGHLALGYALLFAGRPEQGIEAMHTAIRLSPRDPTNTVAWSQLALAHILTRDFDAAVGYARKALADNPANVTASHRLVSALGHKGDLKAAKVALENSEHVMPDATPAYFEGAYAFTDRNTLEYFLSGLRKAGWNG